jgi:hypothetical protein
MAFSELARHGGGNIGEFDSFSLISAISTKTLYRLIWKLRMACNDLFLLLEYWYHSEHVLMTTLIHC